MCSRLCTASYSTFIAPFITREFPLAPTIFHVKVKHANVSQMSSKTFTFLNGPAPAIVVSFAISFCRNQRNTDRIIGFDALCNQYKNCVQKARNHFRKARHISRTHVHRNMFPKYLYTKSLLGTKQLLSSVQSSSASQKVLLLALSQEDTTKLLPPLIQLIWLVLQLIYAFHPGSIENSAVQIFQTITSKTGLLVLNPCFSMNAQ